MQTATRRTTVCIDTRRAINMVASGRKPADVAKESHEQFIRNALKDKMGWPRREPAPEAIKVAAREMAARLQQRDRDLAAVKAQQAADAQAKAAKADVEGYAEAHQTA